MALPNTYKQVEYIESTGTQAFKLGTAFKSSYKTVIDFQFTEFVGDQSPFGMRDSNYIRYYINENQGQWMAATGSSTNPTRQGTVDLNRHTVTLNQGTLQVDSTSYSIPNGTKTYTNGLPVFGYCNDTDNSFYAFASCKIYSLKVYNGSTLLYDLVPCYRKSDKKPGMYDLVNNVFYTNQGTGEFEYPKESGKITYIYLGTNLIRPNELPKSFYYDFRNSSVAAIQQDWTMSAPGNVQYSTTNGIGRSGSAECSLVYINGINLSNVTKKVTMKVGVIRPSSGGVYGGGFSLNNGTKGISFHDNGQNVMVYDTNGQGTSSRPSRSIVGQTGYDLYEWDFENNVMKMTPLGLSTYSYTMQTGQLDIVKTFNRLSGGISTMWWKDILIEWE